MHCYDCFTGDGDREDDSAASPSRETVAVAVCSDCGAGVCPDHLHRGQVSVRASASGTPGRVWEPQTARRLSCLACHRAGRDDAPGV